MFVVLVFILSINFPTDEYFDKYSKTKNGEKSYEKLVTTFSLSMEVRGGLISERFFYLCRKVIYPKYSKHCLSTVAHN